jgi:hypothetical protein
MKRQLKTLATIVVCTVFLTVTCHAEQQPQSDQRCPPRNIVEVYLEAPHNIRYTDDELPITVGIHNRASIQSFLVFNHFAWGSLGNIKIAIRDSKGREVQPAFYADSSILLEKRPSATDFVELFPDHLFAVIFLENPRYLFPRAGTYYLLATYRNPISAPDFHSGNVVFDECGSYSSQPLRIVVE